MHSSTSKYMFSFKKHFKLQKQSESLKVICLRETDMFSSTSQLVN
jgi:hypothetical protein